MLRAVHQMKVQVGVPLSALQRNRRLHKHVGLDGSETVHEAHKVTHA